MVRQVHRDQHDGQFHQGLRRIRPACDPCNDNGRELQQRIWVPVPYAPFNCAGCQRTSEDEDPRRRPRERRAGISGKHFVGDLAVEGNDVIRRRYQWFCSGGLPELESIPLGDLHCHIDSLYRDIHICRDDVPADNTAWTLVPTVPPSVFVTQNLAYLNVTFTNTSNLGVTAYVNAIVATSGGPSKNVGGPVISVGAGGTGGLYLEIGSLANGSYTITFYAANNSNNQQISESETIQFTVQ